MYVAPISTTDVGFGKQLWQALRGNKQFPASGALWLFSASKESERRTGGVGGPGEWRLIIASPRVDEVGRRKAYGELSEITQRMSGAVSDQLLRIVLISPKIPFYQALRSVFGQTASVEGARLGNTQIGGMYIDDAYLYEIR